MNAIAGLIWSVPANCNFWTFGLSIEDITAAKTLWLKIGNRRSTNVVIDLTMENFGPYVYEYWSSVLLEDYSLSLHHIVQKMVDSGLFRFLFKSFGMSHEAAALQWRVYRDVTSRNRGDARSQGCRISDVCRILYCDAEQLPDWNDLQDADDVGMDVDAAPEEPEKMIIQDGCIVYLPGGRAMRIMEPIEAMLCDAHGRNARRRNESLEDFVLRQQQEHEAQQAQAQGHDVDASPSMAALLDTYPA